MNHIRLTLILTIFAVLASSCRQAAEEPDTSADEQMIAQVGEREIQAFSAGDIEGNLSVFTDDLVLMPNHEPIVKGKEAMRAWLQRVHGAGDGDFRYTESDIDVAGDWAIQRYATVGTFTPKAYGSPVEDRGKGIHIYRRQPDGTWLIAQDIFNSDLPAGGAERAEGEPSESESK